MNVKDQIKKRSMLLSGLFLAILLLVLFSSCDRLSSDENKFNVICVGGEVVEKITDCPEYQEEKNETEPDQPGQNSSQTENQTTGPTATGPADNESEDRNITTLRRKPAEEDNTTNLTGEYPNLNGWSIQEIVGGMTTYNDHFIGLVPVTITYDQRNKSVYYLGNAVQKTEDPFFIARHPYHAGAKEYVTNNFRIHLKQTPYEFFDLVEGKKKDAKFKLLYFDQWAEWAKISCKKINSCRNIEAIECTKEEHTLYMWSHSTPGDSYTELTYYNMQAVDDGRETLTTYEQFYCTPV